MTSAVTTEPQAKYVVNSHSRRIPAALSLLRSFIGVSHIAPRQGNGNASRNNSGSLGPAARWRCRPNDSRRTMSAMPHTQTLPVPQTDCSQWAGRDNEVGGACARLEHCVNHRPPPATPAAAAELGLLQIVDMQRLGEWAQLTDWLQRSS